MPVRPRQPADLPACVASLRRVHEASGYPSRWPDDPGAWITPRSMVAAWVAEHDGEVAGHVALVRGLNVECLLRATGLPLEALGGIVRLYVDPGFQRLGLARALLDTVTAAAVDHGLRPVLDVVDDSAPAIALYEQAGWKLAGIQPATWTDPDGSIPLIRCCIGPEGTSAPRPGSANPGNHYLSPPMGWPRFHGFSMITKDLIPGMGTKCFVIMKRLLKSHSRKKHPPPKAHFPRVPGQGPGKVAHAV